MNTFDVMYAYDLGYGQALLALRKEFDIRLTGLKVEASRDLFKVGGNNQSSVKPYSADYFIDVMRQRIDE